MNEQGGHFIEVMEHQAVPPRDDCARKGSMRETVACHEQCRVGRKEPDVNEIEDCRVIAEVEEEVMPVTLLVDISANGEEIQPLGGVCHVHPPKTRVISSSNRDCGECSLLWSHPEQKCRHQ